MDTMIDVRTTLSVCLNNGSFHTISTNIELNHFCHNELSFMGLFLVLILLLLSLVIMVLQLVLTMPV